MTIFLSKLIATILLPITMLAGLIAPQQDVNNLGATGNEIPTTVGLFETTLASAISSSATSFNLTSATYNNGASTLASSTYMFVINEGTSVQEFILADCNGVNCSNAIRGIDRLTGTTTVASLQFSHRRGSSVKITDASLLQISRILNGIGKLPNKLTYQTQPSITSDEDIATKKYADDLAIAGSPNATETVKGIIEIATTAEVIAGTELGTTGAYLSIPVSLATTSNDVATTHLPITGTDGKLNQNFLDLTEGFTHTGAVTFNSATTSLNSTTTIAANSSNKLQLNSIDYIFPSTVASSTVLSSDANGKLYWIDNLSRITAIASDNLKFSADTERSQSNVTYVIKKSVKTYVGGTFRISFDIKGDGTYAAIARIYKNGVAFGTERTSPVDSYQTFSEDLVFSEDDAIELYLKSNYSSGTGYVKNFRVYYDKTLSSTDGVVNTD